MKPLIILGALLPAASLAAAPITVAVTGVRSAEGIVQVAICPEPLWLKTCPITASAPAQPGTTVVSVPNVPPGRYGAFAYHDRNHNGKADTNFIGMPVEDVGFSNDALKRLAPPRFSDAAFDHGTADQHITFRLHHF